jgi:FkbM family methyltransferase
MLLTNDLREDGFGAQYQSILWTILFAEVNGHTFLYSDIPRMDNPSDNAVTFLEKAVAFMNIKGHYPKVDSLGKTPIFAPKWPYFYGEIENNMEEYHSSSSFQKLKDLYYENKISPFDAQYMNVAVHIRRPMKFDIGTLGNSTPNSYYFRIMKHLQEFFSKSEKPLLFHIYSQGDESLFQDFKEFPVQFHLEDDTFDSFNGLVFADILVTSASSYSYTAALLSKGMIVYKQFWHPPRKHWLQVEEQPTMKKLTLLDICDICKIPMENEKYKIPPHIKRVKIDVGLSYGAPFSCKWLEKEDDLIVFGFEPHPHTYQFLRSQENPKYHPVYNHIYPPIPYIDTRLMIFPVALLDKGGEYLDFYEMNGDVGVSSLYKPKEEYFEKKDSRFTVQKITKVPVFTLKDFFDHFPFDRFPYIEYLKIDAQGSDLKIVKGAGSYLQNHVVFITLEADGHQYEGASDCNETNIQSYMTSIDFVRIAHPNTVDPTFVNLKYLKEAESIWILQKH